VEKGDTVCEIVNLLENAYAIKNEGEKGELLAKFYSISRKKGELFVEYLNRLQRVADKLKADHSHEIKEAEIIQRVKSDRGIMHDPAYGKVIAMLTLQTEQWSLAVLTQRIQGDGSSMAPA
jgi:hypothetical protein